MSSKTPIFKFEDSPLLKLLILLTWPSIIRFASITGEGKFLRVGKGKKHSWQHSVCESMRDKKPNIFFRSYCGASYCQRKVTTVPYADPEKRRQFQRQYKRKWRKTQKKINPFRGFKAYVCPRFPGLGVGLAHFDGGFLITN